MNENYGKNIWVVPDGFISPVSNGNNVSHEAVCVLNLTDEEAHLKISLYFEDREPMEDFSAVCKGRRTNHVRLDKIKDKNGNSVPKGVPYSIKVESDIPVIVQQSRMDTSQSALALMTTMAYGLQ